MVEVVAQMRLDALTVEASRCLADAGIPHLLLKGPTTAQWLYDPPRLYRDVDLLIQAKDARAATDSLRLAGIAAPVAGAMGEEAHHSQLLTTPHGLELDLHVALPSAPLPTPADEQQLWSAIAAQIKPFTVQGFDVPAFGFPGRCVVIALHSLSALADSQAVEDLDRARRLAGNDVWAQALVLAAELGVERRVQSALDFADNGHDPEALPLENRLLVRGASGAYQLQRLAHLPLPQLPCRVWAEIFPSPGFMRYGHPEFTSQRDLARAYLVRLLRLTRKLPSQLVILFRELRKG